VPGNSAGSLPLDKQTTLKDRTAMDNDTGREKEGDDEIG
jgi:hypothetical protein